MIRERPWRRRFLLQKWTKCPLRRKVIPHSVAPYNVIHSDWDRSEKVIVKKIVYFSSGLYAGFFWLNGRYPFRIMCPILDRKLKAATPIK
jgi:hypothetical protein